VKNILYLTDKASATSWYRCDVPGAALSKLGYGIKILNNYNQNDLEWCDVLVIERIYQIEVYNAVKWCNEHGRLTVFDIDDDYWNIHYTSPAFIPWHENGGDKLAQLAKMIQVCQKVTTTTPALATILRKFNSNVCVISNNLPDESWPYTLRPKKENGTIVIGWAGSVTHFVDLQQIFHTFTQVLDTYPQTEIHLTVASPEWFQPHERLIFPEAVETADYRELLLTYDIGIAPLADIKFNESKSDLKVLEYAAVGLPIIASKVITYNKAIVPGETGFLAKNSKNWLKYFKLLIEDAELRYQMGINARAWVEDRMISNNIDKWIKAYNLDKD